MDDRHPDTLTDTAIDREIGAVLAVDPSPEFLVRVRTRIADEPVAPGFRSSWVFAAAVAAVLVLAVMVSVSRRSEGTADLKVGTTEIGATSPTRTAVPKIGLTEVPRADLKVSTTDTAATISAVVPTFRSAEPRLAPKEPEVLISADDAKAFQEFIAGVRDARFEILLSEPKLPATSNMVADLSIPPIVIEPLDPSPAVKN